MKILPRPRNTIFTKIATILQYACIAFLVKIGKLHSKENYLQDDDRTLQIKPASFLYDHILKSMIWLRPPDDRHPTSPWSSWQTMTFKNWITHSIKYWNFNPWHHTSLLQKTGLIHQICSQFSKANCRLPRTPKALSDQLVSLQSPKNVKNSYKLVSPPNNQCKKWWWL